MIRKTRNENFSREEKEFVVRFVNEHLKILENKSNTSEVYLKKRDKWRELTEKLKAFGVVRDWKEVRHAYQRWKWFAKKNITALQKWGDSVPASMSPTEFDYMIYNVCSQEFEDDESNFSNESENNHVTNEYDELSNVSHSFDTNSGSYVSHPLQFTEKPMEYTNEILDNLKIKMEQTDEDLAKTCEETRIDNIRVQSTSAPANSTNVTNVSRKSSFDVGEFVHKKQKISSSNDQKANNGTSNNVNSDIEFKRRENILKLKLLRTQLNREEEESKIRMEQEKIKLNILKLQLKRERMLLKNMQSSS
ncbi:hypothetical protein ALC56_10326 [Trachymyrmex septentrionalis]|uniref:Regulatory protein zeste n=1 Tax=Trachymyrmex septentrionalis TaxID=34720 RepID=A0A195F4Q1_9HYME|nr:PREDICTED: uncharacterized protein LOC108751972 [Trachymyrmex septentrionalis]KYN35152.1 hypothetical protein ALC56_10326 [Trachymyrmex septentrionalis]